jgi:hypothetical protein
METNKYLNLQRRRRKFLVGNGRNVDVDVLFKLLKAVDWLHGLTSQIIELLVSADISRMLEYIPEKLPVVQQLNKLPAFYVKRRFIVVFKRPFHWSLSWARSIQSISHHPISLKVQFSIIHPPTSWSSQWSLTFRFCHHYHICISLPTFVLHELRSSSSATRSF